MKKTNDNKEIYTLPFSGFEKGKVYIGRFVFHCHILPHEDKGMMRLVEVFDKQPGGLDLIEERLESLTRQLDRGWRAEAQHSSHK